MEPGITIAIEAFRRCLALPWGRCRVVHRDWTKKARAEKIKTIESVFLSILMLALRSVRCVSGLAHCPDSQCTEGSTSDGQMRMSEMHDAAPPTDELELVGEGQVR